MYCTRLTCFAGGIRVLLCVNVNKIIHNCNYIKICICWMTSQLWYYIMKIKETETMCFFFMRHLQNSCIYNILIRSTELECGLGKPPKTPPQTGRNWSCGPVKPFTWSIGNVNTLQINVALLSYFVISPASWIFINERSFGWYQFDSYLIRTKSI